MTTKGIPFEALSPKDALDLAILIEEEAQERYVEFAEQMDVHHTPEAAAFFRTMAKNEEKHGSELRKRRDLMFPGAPRSVSRAMVFDVEAPDYDEVRAFMSPRQCMQAALRAEQKAHAFFDTALPRVQDPAVRRLFEELRDEEVEHQNLVRQELAKLPPGPEADPDDYGDEPVGH